MKANYGGSEYSEPLLPITSEPLRQQFIRNVESIRLREKEASIMNNRSRVDCQSEEMKENLISKKILGNLLISLDLKL